MSLFERLATAGIPLASLYHGVERTRANIRTLRFAGMSGEEYEILLSLIDDLPRRILTPPPGLEPW